jgi:ABC-2 type transport system ATP-binding protein
MIETHGLRRIFKSRKQEVVAVDGIDLKVEKGEIFGFLGPNGAGKTTTLRMLSTLMKPTSGEAIVAGADLRKQPNKVRERIGYVSQAGSSAPEVSGRDELIIQGRVYGMSKAEAKARAAELLNTLELNDAGDRPTKTYSGGQKRRLDIAIGLAHNPQLLFLDEPTTGLDPQSRARMWEEVRRLRDGGTTVFLTTHYLEEADALCDRLAIIDHGKIVIEGTPDALKRQVAGDVITLGVDGARDQALDLLKGQSFVREAGIEADALRIYVDRGESAMPLVLRIMDGAGISLSTLALSRPSLDDVFLRQTGHSLREAAE